jgi:hypothetical protein
MQTKPSSTRATTRTFRRTMVNDVLYQPIVQQYDRRRYGNETVDAVLAEKGHEEELTEFQALVAMGQTSQALELVKRVARQIRPQVLAEARREAHREGSRHNEQARAALSSGQVSVQDVSPWVRAALEQNRSTLKDFIDKKGQLFQVLCRYFSHLPFKEVDWPAL